MHAEANAVLNTNSSGCSGATLYVTMFPCNECAKLMIQAGISRVIYYEACCQRLTLARSWRRVVLRIACGSGGTAHACCCCRTLARIIHSSHHSISQCLSAQLQCCHCALAWRVIAWPCASRQDVPSCSRCFQLGFPGRCANTKLRTSPSVARSAGEGGTAAAVQH